jgi:5-oxoprolinase (ATP-hydrolysing) subunit A
MGEMSKLSLRDHVLWQVGSLQSLCLSVESTEVKYIKPHGALYHAVMEGGAHAEAVMEAANFLKLPLLLMPTSPLATFGEAFAERRYDGDKLRDRKLEGAVIHDAKEAGLQALSLVSSMKDVDSICVHGDSPNAVEVARVVRAVLEDNGWALRSFVV